jgi:hypothetical protein
MTKYFTASDPDYRGDTTPPVLECDECGEEPPAFRRSRATEGDPCLCRMLGVRCGGTLREVQ